MKQLNKILYIIGIVFFLIFLPLVGVLLQGYPLKPYLEFPPATRYVAHAPFSLFVFLLLSVTIVISIFIIFVRPVLKNKLLPKEEPVKKLSFPLWGWGGVGLMAVSWLIAWTRFPVLQAMRPFTFMPLWMGYIVIVNALTFRRSGTCMMLGRRRHFFLLFIASAFFWWFFEYLNRFVQNWYYIGEKELSSWEYIIRATLSFSTVLPAVLGTAEYLMNFSWLEKYRHSFSVNMPSGHGPLFFFSLTALVSLACLNIRPDILFPMLWLSPLILIVCFQVMMGQRTVFSGLVSGDWRLVTALSMAALICGFFWEMWNFYALPKWEYSIPFVNALHIFEMPLLGYAGYLPFGLECYAVAALFGLERKNL